MTKFDRIIDKQSISKTINQFNDLNLNQAALSKTLVEIAPVDLDELSNYFAQNLTPCQKNSTDPQLA